MSRLQFELITTDGVARRGRLTFPRGTIETPAFMPVGTYGTVKGVLPHQIRALGAEIILGNTFHLYLRPGLDVIEAHGGLHGFARWDKPILTDSGGFQVFSLAHKRKITEEGVTFAAPTDGAKVFLGPEESMRIQKVLDSDIVMIFDECPPVQIDGKPVHPRVVEKSMELSLRWAARSKRAHEGNDAALFGIVQGGVHHDLRTRSAEGLKDIGFDGYAIGGLAVGETEDERNAMLDHTAPQLPQDRPRYLMGVGRPEDLVEAVARGVDMFDCVMPTRNARNGHFFTSTGVIRIRNAKFEQDLRPIEEGCGCEACSGGFTRAYLRHLDRCGEMLGPMLGTLHNLWYYQRLMADMRAAIAAGTFAAFRESFYSARAGNPGA
ncbi:queuine tRNA-ribosyltransferase (tRNA-guanine transglycosylase) (Guanine insertion enzyme) [Luteimonas sp. 9C]|uniref:tRNA guanosine(34) transglycosylase Tgt n=1 Tax=Luteimonas sp. 9C TaxID=2653148 RepID=UPI0012F268A9|nr:tRNA guanosine(34) transglycosylase Tgt [Luteimonas sp. 9C]VXB83466.1 queuine tRNA-ribosyltransferase (tRNA-guanine transglycosylase) (Guanine insertion enzyme) [Luteimonas sp. 9C]